VDAARPAAPRRSQAERATVSSAGGTASSARSSAWVGWRSQARTESAGSSKASRAETHPSQRSTCSAMRANAGRERFPVENSSSSAGPGQPVGLMDLVLVHALAQGPQSHRRAEAFYYQERRSVTRALRSGTPFIAAHPGEIRKLFPRRL